MDGAGDIINSNDKKWFNFFSSLSNYAFSFYSTISIIWSLMQIKV